MLRLLALLSLQPPARHRLLQLRAALYLHLPSALEQPTLLLLILHRQATGFLDLQRMQSSAGCSQGQLGQGSTRTPSRSCMVLGVDSSFSGVS